MGLRMQEFERRFLQNQQYSVGENKEINPASLFNFAKEKNMDKRLGSETGEIRAY